VIVPSTGTVVEKFASATPGTASRWCGARFSVATRARPSLSRWALTTPSVRSSAASRSSVAVPEEAVRT
jgi:hypothetical protein